jgi:ribose/xylose/arabinose/galactoside ABC-type transport system permease subunit
MIASGKGDVAPENGSSPGGARRSELQERVVALVRRLGILPALALLILVGALSSSNFLTVANFRDVLTTASVVGILAIGEALVVLAGGAGIDLSVGANMTLSAIVAARFQEHGAGAVIAAALLTGGYVGLLNGLGVTLARLEPFIVTLATLTMAQGAAYYLSNASPLSLTGSSALPWLNDKVLGLQGPIFVFFIAILIGQAVLSWTVFGRELYFIGGNEEAAHYAGIPVRRRRFAVYVVSGLCGGLAALLVITQLSTADPNFGANYNLQAIAAVVVGGIPLVGGRGSIAGTAAGVIIIALVSDLLGLLNVTTFVQLIVTGLIVILVVGLNRRDREGGTRDLIGAAPLFVGLIVAALLVFKVMGAS